MAKKTLYHSELVGMGPVQANIKSGVLPSKYNGKPSIVTMEIAGEERYYSVENPSCGDALSNLTGQTVTITATGSRADAAIAVTRTGSQVQRQNNGSVQQQRQQPEQRPQRQDQAADTQDNRIEALGGIYRQCFFEAQEIAKEMGFDEKDPKTFGAELKIAGELFTAAVGN